ncbi:MAG: hypothetical protein ACLRRT_02390 [Ruthenibacterium lactatiformans]
MCLAALERRFGAALRDGAQPGEASTGHAGLSVRPLSGAVYSLVMTLDVELCVLAGHVPGALGMQLCTQVSGRCAPLLPESTPVRVGASVSADAGVIGAAATVFERLWTPCSAAADGGAARRGLAQGAPQSNECKLAAASKAKTDSRAPARAIWCAKTRRMPCARRRNGTERRGARTARPVRKRGKHMTTEQRATACLPF